MFIILYKVHPIFCLHFYGTYIYIFKNYTRNYSYKITVNIKLEDEKSSYFF